MTILGIDIGGSGIKGAPVDVLKGEMLTERYRIQTPENATPEAVVDIVDQIRNYFDWTGPIGCTVPARVEHGLVRTAANIHKYWIDTQIDELLERKTGCRVSVLNDADAAGLASMRFGAGRQTSGVVLMLTIGTGIGSALFNNGVLVPNIELGHAMLHGDIVENYASDRIRKQENLSWRQWAERWFLAGPTTHWHARADRAAGRILHAVRIMTKQVAATQDVLDTPKEDFNHPAFCINPQ
jgi:polyphosphate glucokinase